MGVINGGPVGTPTDIGYLLTMVKLSIFLLSKDPDGRPFDRPSFFLLKNFWQQPILANKQYFFFKKINKKKFFLGLQLI